MALEAQAELDEHCRTCNLSSRWKETRCAFLEDAETQRRSELGCRSRVYQNAALQFHLKALLRWNVLEGGRGVEEVDLGFNLHHPLHQDLPFAALRDEDFIISDGKSSLLPSVPQKVCGSSSGHRRE